MLTLADLILMMEKSGRRLTSRTARNWWTVGLLPRPQRTGLGRAAGTVSFWRDRHVILQAQIAHDLLEKGVSLRGTAAGLWLIGFSAPLDVVRAAFMDQVEAHYRRGRGRSRDDLEASLWLHAERFVRSDARAQRGFSGDDQGAALYALTGELLELLCGVGDSTAEAVDATEELAFQIGVLRPFTQPIGTHELPVVREETVEEVVTWIRETASLRRQRDAISSAHPHDWVRARRLARIAVGLLDRAFRAASPDDHERNKLLFTRVAVGWARLSFPVLLALVRKPEQRRSVAGALFAAAAVVRRGPVKGGDEARASGETDRRPRRRGH